ncbi:MAG: hypothetical protein WC284_12670 [Candidimonas sp.]
MRIYDLLEYQIEDLNIDSLIKSAEQKIHGTEIGNAIDAWVGGPHNSIDIGVEYGFMRANFLENIFSDNNPKNIKLKKQLEQAFRPIKDQLRKQVGNYIRLYRGQREIEKTASAQEKRVLLSWTSNPYVGLSFTSARRFMKQVSPEEVEKAIEEYNRTGKTKIFGQTYIRDEENPEYFDIYNDDGHVTGSDKIEEWLWDIYQEKIDWNEEQNEKISKELISMEIPIEEIVWITNRFNQHEFIVRNRGRHRL